MKTFRRVALLACTALNVAGLYSGTVQAGYIDVLGEVELPPTGATLVDGAMSSQWDDSAAGESTSAPRSPASDPKPQLPVETNESSSGMAGGSTGFEASSAPAAAALSPEAPELPLPLVTAWLHHGQFLAVPPAPRSGQCRPP